MKYDDDFVKSSSSSGGMARPAQPKTPVGIIKKSASYRPLVFLDSSRNSSKSALPFNPDNFDRPNGAADELAVVGYSCNLYRDDLMAMKLESRDNLIPWNGDQNLLIDRFDCRGYLYDLDPYDADLLSDERRSVKLTGEEMEVERACDLERYMSLQDNDSESSTSTTTTADFTDYADSSKRYGNMPFNYEVDGSSTATNGGKNGRSSEKMRTDSIQDMTKAVDQSSEKLFVPDEALQLPVGMLVPETVKMNQIVVKTASFVAKQGLQMEILLKTKQANNSQFDFLNFDNNLNPYYKHLIQLIRDNKIDPFVYLVEAKEEKQTSQTEENEDDENSDDDNYLHPLLFKAVEPMPKVVAVGSKPVEDETSNDDIKSKEKEPSESEEKTEETSVVKVIEEPEGVTKTIIDKLAEYVGRNGREFEKTVAKKEDERFAFVNEGHKFYNYYCQMIEQAMRKMSDEKGEEAKSGGGGSVKRTSREREESSSESSSSESSGSEKRERSKEREKDRERRKKRKKEKKSSHHKSSEKKAHKKSKKKHRKRSREKS